MHYQEVYDLFISFVLLNLLPIYFCTDWISIDFKIKTKQNWNCSPPQKCRALRWSSSELREELALENRICFNELKLQSRCGSRNPKIEQRSGRIQKSYKIVWYKNKLKPFLAKGNAETRAASLNNPRWSTVLLLMESHLRFFLDEPVAPRNTRILVRFRSDLVLCHLNQPGCFRGEWVAVSKFKRKPVSCMLQQDNKRINLKSICKSIF